MNTMLEPMLNSAAGSFAGEAGPAMSRSKSRPSFPEKTPERPNIDFAWSADRRDAAPPGFRFVQRGIPFSPLHDM